MNRRFILVYRIILFILAFLGVYLEITKYGVGMLMYYTVLSNLLVLLFTGYLVYLMMRPSDACKAPKILRIKGGVTMSIMITCVVYHLLLAPIATDFYRLDPISWTSVPLVYMAFALFNGFFLKIDIPRSKDNPFPYFFLNVFKKGWPYVIQMCLIIFAAYLVFGFVFYGIKSISFSKKKTS